MPNPNAERLVQSKATTETFVIPRLPDMPESFLRRNPDMRQWWETVNKRWAQLESNLRDRLSALKS